MSGMEACSTEGAAGLAMVCASMGLAKTRSLQGHAARDHPDMAERLWKITDETACGRFDLLRQQSELTRAATQRCVQTRCLVEPALFGQILDEPEAAQDKG